MKRKGRAQMSRHKQHMLTLKNRHKLRVRTERKDSEKHLQEGLEELDEQMLNSFTNRRT